MTMNEQQNSEDPPPFVIPVPHSSQHSTSSIHDTIVPGQDPDIALDNGRTWNLGHEPWPKPVEGKLLLDELAAVYKKFVVLPEWAPEALALRTVHTHASHLREATAYLGIEYPQKPSRKARLLDVLGALVNRPVVSSHIRSRELLRLVDERRPTLLIDEIDNLLSGNDELRGLVNSDRRRSSAFVIRIANAPEITTASKPSAVIRSLPPVLAPGLTLFSSWCPKAMAAISRLPEMFAERCILIRMRRKTRKDHCEPVRNLAHYANSLRRKCARFVLDCSHKIANARPEIPRDMNGRLGDAWEPLLPLADLAGEPWPGLARQAARALAKKRRDNRGGKQIKSDL